MSNSRLFELVYLLLQRRRMTATELAQRFEVSVRTIYRDVDALSAAGVPVYATPGKGGGVALMDHYVLDRAVLDEEEQGQLLTALQSLSGDARLEAEATLSKLSALFRRTQPDWLQVDMSRWGSAGTDNDKFAALKRAVLERRAVCFTYAAAGGRTARRKVLPARLVYKGQGWYLQGFCLLRQDYRTFRLTRVLELEVLEETFQRPLEPPPIEDGGSAPSACIPVRLRFPSSMAYRVYDEFDETCVTRCADGSLRVAVSMPEDAWLYGYLLSFGTGVEVLAPESLRRRLGALAGDICRQNSNPDTGCQHCRVTIGASYNKEDPTMEQKFCQSCGMPLTEPGVAGTEADGSPSAHYCKYCYDKGAFTGEMTMEEMIDFCTPMMVQANPGTTAEQARAQMLQFFPTLLRWKK